MTETLRKLIHKRRESGKHSKNGDGGGGGGGLLGMFLRAKKQQSHNQQHHLTDSQIADNIIGVIFAAHDTTASALTWVLKYLHDNPDVIQAVTV